ncbi:MAG: restriction endonuclease [Phycisphaerales bacterium JB038]
MANWMVRAGRGSHLFEDFVRLEVVSIGWEGVGDLSNIESKAAMRAHIDQVFPDRSKGNRAGSAATCWKFAHVVAIGDGVVTYDTESREYLVGTITGGYQFRPGVIPGHNHVRKVSWKGRVSRDDLTAAAKNTLGSVLTLFEPGEEVFDELQGVLESGSPIADTVDDDEEADEREEIRRDLEQRAHEFIKDQIRALSPEAMEDLTAAILRALGFRARVSPKGPDRGRDVIASPDGLGLQAPRIMAEVKHRPGSSMGAPDIRSFIGGLGPQDRGLYVSTGGFTREAKYEAERSSIPINLVDLDDLASLATEHYDQFDAEGRALLPLVRVYWPAT